MSPVWVSRCTSTLDMVSMHSSSLPQRFRTDVFCCLSVKIPSIVLGGRGSSDFTCCCVHLVYLTPIPWMLTPPPSSFMLTSTVSLCDDGIHLRPWQESDDSDERQYVWCRQDDAISERDAIKGRTTSIVRVESYCNRAETPGQARNTALAEL